MKMDKYEDKCFVCISKEENIFTNKNGELKVICPFCPHKSNSRNYILNNYDIQKGGSNHAQ